MIYTEVEIFKIETSALIASQTLEHIQPYIIPGQTPREINRLADLFIAANYAHPSFMGYQSFPAATCISVNHAVVHGVPNTTEFKPGDIVTVDVGVVRDGFHADVAFTFYIPPVAFLTLKLLDVTRKALMEGIKAITVPCTTGDIGAAIQKCVEEGGFKVFRDISGHGVGRNLHEDPMVPNFGKNGQGRDLPVGSVIAIEPIVTLGDDTLSVGSDGWTLLTTDQQLSAHFEHTVAILADGPKVLTSFDGLQSTFKFNSVGCSTGRFKSGDPESPNLSALPTGA